MSDKKEKRITLKSLNEEFKKEVNILNDKIILLEKRAEVSEEKVRMLEKKLDDTKELADKEQRPSASCHFIVGCKICKETFAKNSDLEIHIKNTHENTDVYDCDICEKSFSLKWRLKKHREGHTSECKKFCHYFNNEKVCPFEEIGCKFLHQDSEICRYGARCQNDLCQFKHIEKINIAMQSDKAEEVIDKDDVTELREKFDKLSYEEKYESKDLLCTLYCKSYEYHRCSQEHFDIFKGCDVMNITEDFVDDNEEDVAIFYPCDKCGERFDEHENLKLHFSANHVHDKSIHCCVSECEFLAQSIEVITMHIGVDHSELIQSRL